MLMGESWAACCYAELQVDVETFQAAQDLDYSLLGGLW
jgi:hypothetical protein